MTPYILVYYQKGFANDTRGDGEPTVPTDAKNTSKQQEESERKQMT